MGYSRTLPYSLLELNTQHQSAVVVTAVAGTKNIRDIALPAFTDRPSYAYVDVITHGRMDSSAAANWLTNSTKVGIKDTGGTFRTSGSCDTGACRVGGSATVYCYEIIPGYTNIAAYLTGGATQTICLGDAQANGSNLDLLDVYGRVRMYFDVV